MHAVQCKLHAKENMRAVVQRVSRCKVSIAGRTVGEIGAGVLVLLGVGKADNEAAADYLAEKIIGLRIFEDEAEKMNLSLLDKRGQGCSEFGILLDESLSKRITEGANGCFVLSPTGSRRAGRADDERAGEKR